jgi:DNA-damage-inducible protein J
MRKGEMAMAHTAVIQIQIEEKLKKEVDNLFEDLGFDTPTAIRMFLKQAVKWHGLPFEVNQLTPNTKTIAAMKEADSMSKNRNVKKYSCFTELLDEVKAEMRNEI